LLPIAHSPFIGSGMDGGRFFQTQAYRN